MKRFLKRYSVDIFFSISFIFLTYIISTVGQENIAVIFRKVAVFSAWSVMWYLSRILKIGFVEWLEEDKKKYSYVYMISSALIFALA